MSIKKNINEFVFPAGNCLSNVKIHDNVKNIFEYQKENVIILFSLPYFTIKESRANFFHGRRLFFLASNTLELSRSHMAKNLFFNPPIEME